MKIFKLFLAVLIFSATQSTLVKAQDDPFKKSFKKSFEISENTLLKLDNKYGDIHIENWNEKAVNIAIDIIVNSKDKKKAQKVFEAIKITLEKSGSEILGATEINGNLTNVKFKVLYKVKMPANLDLDMQNKYGNIYADKLLGKTDITLKYGSFKINEIGKKGDATSQVFFGYAKGIIEKANELNIGIKYSTLEIGKSPKILMVSKYSNIKFGEIGSLKVESSYDSPLKIKRINTLEGIAKYSSLEIEQLTRKLEFDAKYTDIEIDKTSNEFSFINLNLKYGKALLNIAQNASYSIDSQMEYGNLKYPENAKLKVLKDDFEESISGTVGKSEHRGKIKIKAKYANITL